MAEYLNLRIDKPKGLKAKLRAFAQKKRWSNAEAARFFVEDGLKREVRYG